MQVFKDGVNAIRQHLLMFIVSSGIIAVCMLLVVSFGLLSLNVRNNLNSLIERNEFVVSLSKNLSDDEIQQIGEAIENISNVESVTLKTSEDTLTNLSERIGNDLTTGLDANIFPARYTVKVADISLINETVSAVKKINNIDSISVASSFVSAMVTTRESLYCVFLIVIAMLAVISIFIISGTMRMSLNSRYEEISVMKMIGASNMYIQMPFVIEGAFMGLASTLTAFVAQIILHAVTNYIFGLYGFSKLFELVNVYHYLPIIFAIYFIGCMLFSIGGSVATVSVLLHKTER